MLNIRRKKKDVQNEESEMPVLEQPIAAPVLKVLSSQIQCESDFSQYLSESVASVETRNKGVSSRVDKILRFLHLKDKDVLDFNVNESWQIEKLELEDRISLLEKELKEVHNVKVDRVFVEVGRRVVGDGVLEELEILRKENERLRNASGGKNFIKLIMQLREEIAELGSRNENLRKQLLSLSEPPMRPPMRVLVRQELALDEIEDERISQVIENEWKEATENCRVANPLKNPFERRRFNAPNFPTLPY